MMPFKIMMSGRAKDRRVDWNSKSSVCNVVSTSSCLIMLISFSLLNALNKLEYGCYISSSVAVQKLISFVICFYFTQIVLLMAILRSMKLTHNL